MNSKSKVFIASSHESLSISYAIQENLEDTADVTVWTQGAFDLSKTTIESLMDILEEYDFGIFVFSPDDISKMGEMQHLTVRDNVIFELGLFIGKLGRNRSFIVSPSNIAFHIPTDLLGITPGKYNSNRGDENFKAATGPVCNQIRTAINKLGSIRISKPSNEPDDSILKNGKEQLEKIDDEKKLDGEWLINYFNNNFQEAHKILSILVSNPKEEENKLVNSSYLLFCEFKLYGSVILDKIERLIEEHNENPDIYIYVSQFLYLEDYFIQAKKIIERGLSKFDKNHEMHQLNANCIESTDSLSSAINYLKENHNENIELVVSLSHMHEKNGDIVSARKIIHKYYQTEPNNEKLIYRYARISDTLLQNNVSLFLYNKLVVNYLPKDEYWGYLGNTCLNLNLYDRSYISYRKGVELSGNKAGWIISNIGNILNNKGFYSEAIKYLHESLAISNESVYAHDKLAIAIKNQETENTKYSELIEKGRKELKEFNPDI
jgi:tetratricopeptide (TPR) repeat protein